MQLQVLDAELILLTQVYDLYIFRRLLKISKCYGYCTFKISLHLSRIVLLPFDIALSGKSILYQILVSIPTIINIIIIIQLVIFYRSLSPLFSLSVLAYICCHGPCPQQSLTHQASLVLNIRHYRTIIDFSAGKHNNY
jgi:hypothetical protein